MSTSLEALEVSVSPLEKFSEYLSTKGMRLTNERSLIVEEVFSSHEHFDADEMADRLTLPNSRRRASRATVYRTLNALVSAGMLRKVARPNGREVYEHDYGYPRHDHLICKNCQRLIEFRNQEISQAVERIAAENGFRMEGHRLEVYGLCDRCSRPPQRRHHKLEQI